MDVKLVDKGETGELLLDGRLEATNANDAEELFLQMADRFTNLTLNLASLSYISSAGLRVLKKTYMKVHGKGGVLTTTSVNEYVREVFEMTGFASILNIQ